MSGLTTGQVMSGASNAQTSGNAEGENKTGTAIGSVVGGIAGAYFGGPVGAMIGSQLGGYIGGQIEGQIAGNSEEELQQQTADAEFGGVAEDGTEVSRIDGLTKAYELADAAGVDEAILNRLEKEIEDEGGTVPTESSISSEDAETLNASVKGDEYFSQSLADTEDFTEADAEDFSVSEDATFEPLDTSSNTTTTGLSL